MTTPTPPPIEEVRDLLGQIDEAIEQVQQANASDAEAPGDESDTADRAASSS